MKNILLLLSVLIVAPAWAGETTEPASTAQTAVTVQLSGSAKGVRALLAELGQNAVYKEAGCSAKPMKKSAKTARISCANASGALMDFLGKNAPTKVHWSITAEAAKRDSSTTIQTKSAAACVYPPCKIMTCPPPNGQVKCCNTTTFAAC